MATGTTNTPPPAPPPTDINDASKSAANQTFGGAGTPASAADASYTAVTGISTNTAAYRLDAPRAIEESDPPQAVLNDVSDRRLGRISEKVGRATLTVMMNAELKREQSEKDKKKGKPIPKNSQGLILKYKTADFIVQNIQIGSAETIGVDINNIGFTLHATGSNPETIAVQGSLLNGDDYKELFASPGMIVDTDWFSKFVNDYANHFKASKAIANGDRIFFNYKSTTYEVYIIGFNTVETAESPVGAQFVMQMIVKKKWLAPKTLAAIKQAEAKQQPYFISNSKDKKTFGVIKLPKDYVLKDGVILLPASKDGIMKNILNRLRGNH